MELEIKVMWCRGLTAFNFFQKLTVYANVSIHSQDQRIQLTPEQKQEQKTQVDEDGDGNPEWHYTMNFNLKNIPLSTNLHNFSLLFELRNHAQFLKDRNIGEVRVPLEDLIESVGFGVVRFASYEVRDADGKPNGVLDFSYKVSGDLGEYDPVRSGSEIQISGYSHNHDHDPDHLDQFKPSNPEKIEYPRLDFEDFRGNAVHSTPPLIGGYQNRHFEYYPPNTSQTMTTNTTHYPPPSYPPPGPPSWAPMPPQYPPPPPPPRLQPLEYQPPPPPPPPPFGDHPHWGYEYRRPPPEPYYHHGYEHHHW